jgi:hypothetical protein
MLINKYDNLFNGTSYFVRTEHVSLKQGMYGIGPYYDYKSIIKSITTCGHKHSPIFESLDELTIYLLPWKDIKEEFRLFVCNKSLTAISQQNYTQKLNVDKNVLERYVSIICDFYDKQIVNKIEHVDDYTIDIAITEKGTPYFIEINSFGKEYAAGSSLFHWINDEKQLYGLDEYKNILSVRYTV